MKRYLQAISTAAVIILAVAFATNAQVAGNPPYALEQSVIAGGGGTSADAGNTYSITGSIGQAISGTSNASSFKITSGFFTAAAPLAPTAASVSVGGRVLTADGRGIRSVVVVMTDSGGTTRTAISTAFGYFHFADVPAGDTYVFRVRSKRFEFARAAQVVSVSEDTDNIEFVAFPQ